MELSLANVIKHAVFFWGDSLMALLCVCVRTYARSLLTAWWMRGSGITGSQQSEYFCSSGICLSKDTSLWSYISTPFLFHIVPLLTRISIQCILFHIPHYTVGVLRRTVCCSFHALSRINSQGNQQNELCCFINVCSTLYHRRFLYVSIYNIIIIRAHKLNIAWNTVDFCIHSCVVCSIICGTWWWSFCRSKHVGTFCDIM
jgi:hypothetical protein